MSAKRKPRLTQARLKAAEAAITAMLAGGGPGEGDWPKDVTAKDLEGALEAVTARIADGKATP